MTRVRKPDGSSSAWLGSLSLTRDTNPHFRRLHSFYCNAQIVVVVVEYATVLACSSPCSASKGSSTAKLLGRAVEASKPLSPSPRTSSAATPISASFCRYGEETRR
ncbi:hypothetical protein TPAR_07426 [Tolypocladium paradoxum]|uniref:Uncharacterized protein n=1 Tax=Tolypocladium paradoxum TaxID=94208 RepID=A0A2S4KQB5_9HYPO|nr:hypothetical protein TPAR_07426 [Tolypocladium paradoxum]